MGKRSNSYWNSIQLRRFTIKRLKSNGFSDLNGKPVQSCKSKEIVEYYKLNFGSDPSIDMVGWEEKKAARRSGKIYVFGNMKENICKIGFSVDPEKRLDEVQTGCPYDLFILAIFDGTISLEKQLHRQYRQYRTRNKGEWFRLEGALLQELKPYMDQKSLTKNF